MKNQKIIAFLALGLVIVAGVKMYKKSAANQKSADFANASGNTRVKSQNCAVCRDSEGNNYHTGNDRTCAGRDTCVTRYAYSQIGA